jgi:hypothetical protein
MKSPGSVSTEPRITPDERLRMRLNENVNAAPANAGHDSK